MGIILSQVGHQNVHSSQIQSLEKHLLGMKRVKMPKLVYICFLSIPVLLLIYLCSSLSVPKHHNPLFSTYEFIIIMAKSRTMAVFVMFNVIIVTIFLGSYKESAEDFDGFFHPSPVIDEVDYAKENQIDEGYDSYDEDYDEYHGYDGYEEDNDDDIGTEDVDSEDEIDVDLERRIEEFIAKVYEKWREELVADPKLLCIAAATE